jgi:UDP-N-acetylmuramoylalanine--D-glutamate ligase
MDWTGRRVVIIGAARQGTALARYLARHGARVTITDQKAEGSLQDVVAQLADLPIRWQLGGSPLELLDDCDLLCPSGGVPLELPIIVAAQRRGLPLSNDSQIFLEAAPCRVIGITGSAGKTTTTTLVGRMAQSKIENRKSKIHVGGNIGSPLIAVLDEMTPADLAVMELSSFQLELMTRSPQVAAITNITPNHLDRHGTMDAYTAAKARILHFQQKADFAVLNRQDPISWSLVGQVHGSLLSFGLQRPPAGQTGTFVAGGLLAFQDETGIRPLFPRSLIQLRGEHNLLNVLAACAIGIAAGLPVEALRAGVEGFGGVAHRLEFVRTWGGASWYNDSIATTPERVMAEIRSFDEPLVLLIGGRDKHLPWDDFAALARQRVDHIVLFGEMGGLVQQALQKAGLGRCTLDVCANLRDAVETAAALVAPGDVVLLSPGGTSFDEFRDFEARGDAFRQLVHALP